jgi:hypothetical protein
MYTPEIVNAICLNFAARRGVDPRQVEVSLSWDEEFGFTAEVFVQGRSQFIVESGMMEALEQYVWNTYHARVFREQITLDADDDANFWADIVMPGEGYASGARSEQAGQW